MFYKNSPYLVHVIPFSTYNRFNSFFGLLLYSYTHTLIHTPKISFGNTKINVGTIVGYPTTNRSHLESKGRQFLSS